MGWAPELALAMRAARAAGEVLASRPTEVVHKGSIDLVTDVDARCEARVREVLLAEAPTIPVLGEEGGGGEQAPVRWVVDPLDGTTNFVHGFPWYACSIALEVDGVSRVGVVLDAVRGRLFTASEGAGAWCEGTRLSVSTTSHLSQCLLGTGFPYDRASRAGPLLERMQRALEQTRGVRRAGAASLDLAMVAAGALDGFWEEDLKLWDVAAGILLIREAGGRVTPLSGPETSALSNPCSPLASNGALHDALVQLLGGRQIK